MVSHPGERRSLRFSPSSLPDGAPLIPYILELDSAFPLSIAFTGFAFFAVGASRSLVTRRQWYVNGAKMFVVGMAAAAVAYTVGNLLGGVA